MPNLRTLLGKQVDAIPRPKTYSFKLGFEPVALFEGQTPSFPISICQPAPDSEIVPRCSITPNLLPLLLELAQPEATRATYLFGLDSVSRETYLSPRVIEAERFPLATQLLHIAVLFTPLAVSSNLFQLLVTVRVFGMNYRDRILRELRPPESEEQIAPRKVGTKPLSKSYIEPQAERRRGHKPEPKPPSIWDLLYVILQPPIVLESLENPPFPDKIPPYQWRGIRFLMDNESALLADDMGTGKTVMTIVALRILVQRGRASCALIVCPVSVLRQWNQELAKWSPDLRVTFVRGTQGRRELDWRMPAHVYVATYDTLRSDIETGILPKDKLTQFDIVALDEAQNIKNPASGRSLAILQLRARQRWALTGTPMENKIEDLVSLFEFLRPGYLMPFDLYPTRVKEKIAPYFLRRRKEDVLTDLPPMQKQDMDLELDPEQRAAYDQAFGEIRTELSALGTRVTKVHIFSSIIRLKQICNFAPGQFTSPKLDLLKEQIEEITASEHKVIVFSQFIDEGIDKLEKVLEPYGTAKIVGEQSDLVRDREVNRFKQSPGAPILLASLRAGGVGLNLTEATYVVHFDHWWNPAVMWQAEARAHRKGQKHGVNVYSYWMVDTIEDKIRDKLEEKGLRFKEVVDGLSEPVSDDLISTDEWLEIFDVKNKEQAQPQPTRQATLSLSLAEIRDRLYMMTPAAFEHLVKDLMHHFGYPHVKVTGRTGDGGIDVISARNTSDGIVRVVAQCKRYRGTVGVDVARDLRGVLASDQSIQKGFLVTTGEISRDCLAFCEKSGVIAPIDGLQVANYIRQFGLAI